MATKGNVGRGGGRAPANVTKHLKGIDFPANKQDLIKHAQQSKADQEVMSELQGMEEREYGSMADVMKGFGKGQKAASRGKSSQQPQKKSLTRRRWCIKKEPESLIQALFLSWVYPVVQFQ